MLWPILILVILFLICAHAWLCWGIAMRQCHEAMEMMTGLSDREYRAGNREKAGDWAQAAFNVNEEQHFFDLLFFRNPWNRYPVEVQLALGQF